MGAAKSLRDFGVPYREISKKLRFQTPLNLYILMLQYGGTKYYTISTILTSLYKLPAMTGNRKDSHKKKGIS